MKSFTLLGTSLCIFGSGSQVEWQAFSCLKCIELIIFALFSRTYNGPNQLIAGAVLCSILLRSFGSTYRICRYGIWDDLLDMNEKFLWAVNILHGDDQARFCPIETYRSALFWLQFLSSFSLRANLEVFSRRSCYSAASWSCRFVFSLFVYEWYDYPLWSRYALLPNYHTSH